MTEHVKIYGIKPRIQYVADGTLNIYEFPFAIFNASDIDVYFGDTLQDTSTYSVSEARHSDGGSVTFEVVPESGTIITIVRNLSIERTSDFQEGSTLRAKVLNDELDYQIACQQQIAENLNRSMVLPPYATDADVDLTLPVPSAGKAIVWNSDGTNLENSTVAVNDLESILKGYKTAAETAASTATTKAGIASDKADIATQKADIATQKANEATATLASKANKDMDNLSTTGKTGILDLCMPDYTAGVEYTSNASGTLTYDSKVVVRTSVQSYNSASFAVLDSNNNILDIVRCYGKTFSDNKGICASASGFFPKGSSYEMSFTNGGGTTGSSICIYPLKGSV